MTYTFRFGPVPEAYGDLLAVAWLTLQLSASAMLLGLVVAIICAWAKTSGPKPLRLVVDCYIEIIRNTLFLVQIFFILFGLPAAGLRLSPNAAALLAMVINVGAYATEIIRAGIESIRKGQVEAGLALGVKPLQVLWAPAPVVMVTLRRGTDVIAHHVPVPHQGRPAQERGWLARRTLPAVPPN